MSKKEEEMNQILCEKNQIKLQDIKQMELYEENYALLENGSKYVGPVINGRIWSGNRLFIYRIFFRW